MLLMSNIQKILIFLSVSNDSISYTDSQEGLHKMFLIKIEEVILIRQNDKIF